MMPDLITSKEAAAIVGIAGSTFSRRAAEIGMYRKSAKMSREEGGTHYYLYRRSEVEKMARERNVWKKGHDMPSSAEARRVRDWVDGLDSWPTKAEIAAMASSHYRAKDIESVLETRVYRKDADGEYLKPLREPAMKRPVIGRRK